MSFQSQTKCMKANRCPADDLSYTNFAIIKPNDFPVNVQVMSEPYDTDEMAREFLLQFSGQAFTEGQLLAFRFLDKKVVALTVKSLEGADLSAIKAEKEPKPKKTRMGRCLGDTIVQFEKPETSCLNLTGKSKRKTVRQSIINSNFDFNKMGIGGLDRV